MQLVTALIYWVVVALWLAILATVIAYVVRGPRLFGVTWLLLLVLAIDAGRNVIENIYFGLFFGSQYGLLPKALEQTLGNPWLLILPKLVNIAAAGVVLGLMLLRWLPSAVRERAVSEQLARDLELLATTDSLTGLSNRRQFESTAGAEWARFQRYSRPLSLMVLDIDHFKSVNDRFGHDAGDLAIKAVAQTLQKSKRQTDVVARIGGEEFAVLLPETDEAAASIAAERLRQAVESQLLVLPGANLKVTVSIGIAGARHAMAAFDVMLKCADAALYEAKHNGRNRIVVAPRQTGEVVRLAAE
jgi:diguanylate cyclase (GGDEF)-like protein